MAQSGLYRALTGNGRSWWLRTVPCSTGLAYAARHAQVGGGCPSGKPERCPRLRVHLLERLRYAQHHMMAVLFRRLLGVSMVSSLFVTYRDAFVFALSVHWDVDVARSSLFLVAWIPSPRGGGVPACLFGNSGCPQRNHPPPPGGGRPRLGWHFLGKIFVRKIFIEAPAAAGWARLRFCEGIDSK